MRKEHSLQMMGKIETTMSILSAREHPEWTERIIAYFQKHWASEDSMMVYEDCIKNCIHSPSPLPQWYVMVDGDTIIGCAGLITNDFISRMDLYPWICALYIEEAYRGHAYGSLLLARAEEDAAKAGYPYAYLCTDHVGYYEKYGFEHIGTGYHPWGETSGIYRIDLQNHE
ncbi:MAG: GNAT family N-acetyltransferase [Clostridiales bacterium]|nr:GNAT family N-acetyltransferase [Clostridiales bacterium]